MLSGCAMSAIASPSSPGYIRALRARLRLLAGLRQVAQCCLGLVFLWSSLAKWHQPYDFLRAVYGYSLVGPQVGLWVAIMVPWAEFITGLALITGIAKHGALALSTLLLALFCSAQGSALVRGLQVPCGCFNGATELITPVHFGFTGSLLIISAVLLWNESHRDGSSIIDRPAEGAGPDTSGLNVGEP